jgi:hypothetical protein
MGGILLDRWTARLTSPYVSVMFASVSKAQVREGIWLMRFTPKGADIDCPWQFIDYASKEKAIAQVERWRVTTGEPSRFGPTRNA